MLDFYNNDLYYSGVPATHYYNDLALYQKMLGWGGDDTSTGTQVLEAHITGNEPEGSVE